MQDKKTTIITGAAKGIGKEIAKRLVSDGFFAVIVDIDKTAGESLANELGVEHAQFVSCDISKEDDVKTLFLKVLDEHQQLDALVNNAGIIRDNMIHKMPVENFDIVININLKGTWLMCREAAIIMREQKAGRIVNISSRAWLGNMGQTNYAASKAAIIGLTRTLALELGRYNVYVNAVAPGLIDTPLTQGLTDEVRQRLIDAQPTKSMGKPEDIANAVSFLVSEKTNFITGNTLYVDGGKCIGAGI